MILSASFQDDKFAQENVEHSETQHELEAVQQQIKVTETAVEALSQQASVVRTEGDGALAAHLRRNWSG